MKTTEDKQKKALQLLDDLKPQLLRLILGSPSFGMTYMRIHWMDGEVKRTVLGFRESIIPVDSENTTSSKPDSR